MADRPQLPPLDGESVKLSMAVTQCERSARSCMAFHRSPVEADAETIRAAILLDELEASQPQRTINGGRIIVEVKTLNALSVLQFSCSVRVMALHTGEMNARRSATHAMLRRIIRWRYS